MINRYLKSILISTSLIVLLILFLYLSNCYQLFFTIFRLLSSNTITILIQYLITILLGLLGLYYAFAFIGYQSFRRDYGKEVLMHYLSEISPGIFTLFCIIWIFVLLSIVILKEHWNLLVINYLMYISISGCLLMGIQLYISYQNFYKENFLHSYIFKLMDDFYQDAKLDKNIPNNFHSSYQNFQKMCLHALTVNNALFPDILFLNYSDYVIKSIKKNLYFDLNILNPLEKEISNLCEKFENITTINSVLSKYVDLINNFSRISTYSDKKKDFALITNNFFTFNERIKKPHYRDIVTPHIANVIIILLNKADLLSKEINKQVKTFLERLKSLHYLSDRRLYPVLMNNVECLENLLSVSDTKELVKSIFISLNTGSITSNDGLDDSSFNKVLNEDTVKSDLFSIVYPVFVNYSIRLIRLYISIKNFEKEIKSYIDKLYQTTEIAISKELFDQTFFQQNVLDIIKTLKPYEVYMKENNIDFDKIKKIIADESKKIANTPP